MLMYIGGMQMTPRPTYAPSRIVDPPGTTRTPARDRERLQRQRVLVEERPPPVIGRHVGERRRRGTRAGCPASPTCSRASRSATPGPAPPREPCRPTAPRAVRRSSARASCLGALGAGGDQRLDARPAGRRSPLTRAPPPAAGPSSFSTALDLRRRVSGRRRHHRQPVRLLDQPHHREARLHGDRVRFDEVDGHQRAAAARGCSRAAAKSLRSAASTIRDIGAGHLVRRDRDHAARRRPPSRAA